MNLKFTYFKTPPQGLQDSDIFFVTQVWSVAMAILQEKVTPNVYKQ